MLEEEREMGCRNNSVFDTSELDDLNHQMKEIHIGADVTLCNTNGAVLDSDKILIYVEKVTVKDNVENLIKVASIPDDWVMSENNEGRGEPAYINVNNLGE